jgi:hypothetical protein
MDKTASTNVMLLLQLQTRFSQNHYAWWVPANTVLAKPLCLVGSSSLNKTGGLTPHYTGSKFICLLDLRFLGFSNHPLFIHVHVVFTSYLFLVYLFLYLFSEVLNPFPLSQKKKMARVISVHFRSVFIPTYKHKQQLPTTQEGAQLVEVQSQTRAHLEQ